MCALLILLCAASRAEAQCESAPSAFSTACTEMQGYLSTFNATLSSQWNGTKSPPVAFGTELLSANDNLGLTGLLAPNALTRVQAELDGLARVGVQFVTFAVAFPILYQPFYEYNKDPQDYASVLTFYQNVMAAARQRGMKVLIESPVVFPAYATDLPLQAYYATLSTSQVTAGRAQVAQIVAQQLQPDWLNLGSEPDTQAYLVGLTAEYTPQEWATDISTIVSQLRSAGINGKPLIGAGCGAWQQNGSAYVQALMSTGIDYFDAHIFSVNLGYLNDLETYLDMAIAAGKGTAISEAWLHKITDAQLQGQSEFGIIGVLSGAEPWNAYSFGATEDAEFLGEMIGLSYSKHLYYLSPFESEIFFAYLDYNQTSSLTAAQLTAQETAAASAASASGTLSSLGKWFAAAIKPTGAATVSSTSGTAPVAPASLVSIYGTGLAATSASATSLPLPVTLAGTSATIVDAGGVQAPLPLFYAGPTQMNAEIPENAATGPAVITINAPSGPVVSPVVLTPVAPGLFSQNDTGAGVATAIFVTTQANGTQTFSYVFNNPCQPGSCVPVPFDVSAGNSALVLYGTGIRGAAALSDVTVQIGSQTLPVLYAGAAPDFVGLDQVNVALPASLAGSGTVNVSVSVSGAVSNTVTVAFK